MSATSLVILNYFGGPGSGKSTLAAATFAALKFCGIRAELVTEYAKQLHWEGRLAGYPQKDLVEEQIRRIDAVVASGVDVIVTDSPILQASAYTVPSDMELLKTIIRKHRAHPTINIRVKRVKPYETVGRSQTKEQAEWLDALIDRIVKQEFDDHGRLSRTYPVTGDLAGFEELLAYLAHQLQRPDLEKVFAFKSIFPDVTEKGHTDVIA